MSPDKRPDFSNVQSGFGTTETNSIGTKLQVTIPLGGLGCTVAGCSNSGEAATQIS